MAKKPVSKKKVALGVGLGLAAAAAAGAGYFFFGSKDGAKHRKQAAKWAQTLHADALKKAKRLQKLDEKAWKTIVDESMRAYEKVKSVDKADLASAARELKSNWKHVSAEFSRVAKKDTKAVKAVAKKAVRAGKKAVAKAVSKKTVSKKKTAKK